MTDQPSQTSASGRAVVNTVTGAALVISALGSSISLAALIFSGPLEPGLPQATSAFIISAGVMSLVIALRSPLVPAVAMSQDAPAVVTAAIAAGYVASDGSTTGTDVLVVLAVITAATGLALVVLGSTGGSHIVRYLPHSVVSGFIAGTGWLLFKGGIEVMARTSVSLDSLDTFASGEIVRLWLPGLALGVLVTGLSSRPNLPVAAASAVVAIAAVMFYAVTYAFSSLSEAERDGWLMGPFDGASQVSLITPTELGEAPWGLVAESSAGLGGVVLVALVALLLNLSGLETLTRSRLDLDRELRMVGWTNLASAPLGATPVFHALGDTALARRMGVHGRRITVVVAVPEELSAQERAAVEALADVTTASPRDHLGV